MMSEIVKHLDYTARIIRVIFKMNVGEAVFFSDSIRMLLSEPVQKAVYYLLKRSENIVVQRSTAYSSYSDYIHVDRDY